jgi:hypothetical protein
VQALVRTQPLSGEGTPVHVRAQAQKDSAEEQRLRKWRAVEQAAQRQQTRAGLVR